MPLAVQQPPALYLLNAHSTPITSTPPRFESARALPQKDWYEDSWDLQGLVDYTRSPDATYSPNNPLTAPGAGP